MCKQTAYSVENKHNTSLTSHAIPYALSKRLRHSRKERCSTLRLHDHNYDDHGVFTHGFVMNIVNGIFPIIWYRNIAFYWFHGAFCQIPECSKRKESVESFGHFAIGQSARFFFGSVATDSSMTENHYENT